MARVIAAIVLAAGASTRMGAPKALLPDGRGRPFIVRLLHTFSEAGFRHAIVVTGAVHAGIVAAVAADAPCAQSVTFARNPAPERGQLSSLVVGLGQLKPGVRAALVTLVDAPFVTAATVRTVVSAYEATNALIVRPAQGPRHGHPVLFDARLFRELHDADPQVGAKAVVRAHAAGIVHVETADDGAFVDVDTPDEYAKALGS